MRFLNVNMANLLSDNDFALRRKKYIDSVWEDSFPFRNRKVRESYRPNNISYVLSLFPLGNF